MNQPTDWLLIRGGKSFRLSSGIGEDAERELLHSLCTFINANGLSRAPLPELEAHDWEGFEIRYSHLTDLGQALMKAAFSRWLAAIDQGTKPSQSKILDRALERLCKS